MTSGKFVVVCREDSTRGFECHEAALKGSHGRSGRPRRRRSRAPERAGSTAVSEEHRRETCASGARAADSTKPPEGGGGLRMAKHATGTAWRRPPRAHFVERLTNEESPL